MLRNFFFLSPHGKFFFVRGRAPKGGDGRYLSFDLSARDFEIMRAQKERVFFFLLAPRRANVNERRVDVFFLLVFLVVKERKARARERERERERESTGNEEGAGEQKGKIRKFFSFFLVGVVRLLATP